MFSLFVNFYFEKLYISTSKFSISNQSFSSSMSSEAMKESSSLDIRLSVSSRRRALGFGLIDFYTLVNCISFSSSVVVRLRTGLLSFATLAFFNPRSSMDFCSF